ncbi:MAG: hypothetical protein H0V36_12510 [Chloroflexi bacterium]|nr:hypothetical protein [Chloroflexota bacterium]
MAASTKQAQQGVVAARRQLGHELDEMRLATRSAVDIPAKVRKHPVETIGLIGGAGFLALGGPKRIIQAIEHRVRPTRKDRLKGILPKDIERMVDKTGQNAEQVRQRLEQDFFDWMAKRRPQQAPANARQSLWKTYDSFIGPLGALGAKSLIERLLAADPKRGSGASGSAASGSAASAQDRPEAVSSADMVTARIAKKISGGG